MSPQCKSLLCALKRGARLTVWEAIHSLGIYALSQRVGELKRAGYRIKSRLVETPTGKHIAKYWM
jgi:hypothetical protein